MTLDLTWQTDFIGPIFETVVTLWLCILQENWQKLIELQRGLVGIDNLVQPNRVSLLSSRATRWPSVRNSISYY